MESFSNWITSNQTLNTLKVSIFSNISSVGWQSFASAPSSLDHLEDIEIEYHCEMLLLNAFIAKPTLKRVSLTVDLFAQLQAIANVRGSPNCSINELEFNYPQRNRFNQTLVNSLQRNTSVHNLKCRSVGIQLLDFHWPSVSNLLCDTSSIDATIQPYIGVNLLRWWII